MKIADLRLTGLTGGTVEGGWAEELTPADNINTVVEVITDDGLVGIGSAMTSVALVGAAANQCNTDRDQNIIQGGRIFGQIDKGQQGK